MAFSAEINIRSENGFDMTLDCPKVVISSISEYLEQKQFNLLSQEVVIQGSENINDLIELTIKGSDFDELRESIIEYLVSKGVSYNEEQFNRADDLHIMFRLNDISIFDK